EKRGATPHQQNAYSTRSTSDLSNRDAGSRRGRSEGIRRRSGGFRAASRGEEGVLEEALRRGADFLIFRITPSRWKTWKMRWSFSDRKSTRLNASHVKISYAVFG